MIQFYKGRIAMYPSFMTMLNCSRETKLATVLRIDNTRRRGTIQYQNAEELVQRVTLSDHPDIKGLKVYDVNNFFLDAIYTEANAFAVAERFNLPNFTGIKAWMEKHHPDLSEFQRTGQPV